MPEGGGVPDIPGEGLSPAILSAENAITVKIPPFPHPEARFMAGPSCDCRRRFGARSAGSVRPTPIRSSTFSAPYAPLPSLHRFPRRTRKHPTARNRKLPDVQGFAVSFLSCERDDARILFRGNFYTDAPAATPSRGKTVARSAERRNRLLGGEMRKFFT